MAPYGDDITESLPLNLSNPVGSINYSNTGESYDMSINGSPFFLYIGDEYPYRRDTAQYRKQQIDQSNEPGEQSITGWWIRSQSSFHKGSGIKFYDPSAGETISYRFANSKGVDVWSKGKVTLLNSCIQNHVTTGAIASNDRPFQFMRSINFNGIASVLLHDEYDVDKVYNPLNYSITTKSLTGNVATLTTSVNHKYMVGTTVTITDVDATFNGTYDITAVTTNTFSYAKTATNVSSTAVTPNGVASSTVTHFIDYNAGTAKPVYAICDDGTTAYWVTNELVGGNQRLTVRKKSLTESSATTGTLMFQSNSIEVNNAVMDYVKDRLVMAANNVIYEFTTNTAAMPSALYTHPASSHVYTSIAASGSAIYLAGYNGIQSTIQRFTLSTTGAMPTLSGGAITAAEMPTGERIFKIFYYLGYMLIGTDKGIRVADVQDDGSIKYGPLIVETVQPCYDFAARDRFVWCATSVDGEPGIIRMDLGEQYEALRFAYANDLYYPNGVTSNRTTAVAFLNGTDDITFCTSYGATNGNVYREDSSTLMTSGYIQTGLIRFSTLESKIFKALKARIDNTYGSINLKSIDSAGNEYGIGSFAEGDFTPEVSVTYPVGPQEYLAFKFTISRYSLDASKGPTFSGYQLKALPAIPRQRLISYPLLCYDIEKDVFGNITGHDGAAFEKLVELETIESSGDTVRVEDYRTGESYLGVIEQLEFINKTPTDKRFSGFGGVLVATIRTI